VSRATWPKLSTSARITHRGRITHVTGRGGAEADRTRHQAPARRLEGHSLTRRAAHLARRRTAHHHPTKRESITCEINLPRAGADRKVAGIIAADDRGALYLCHSGRMGGSRPGQRKSGFREFLADGVWRKLGWPDGEETEALVIAPLDSPRLTRLLGQFVDAVRRFKAGEPPMARTGLCVEPSIADSANAACDRRLVDVALHEELAKRGLFGGARDLFSLRGERPQPLFALVANGGPEELAMAVGSLSLASARGGPDVRPILVAPAALADPDSDALQALPFAFVRFRWRGARAVFDGLDDALE
jgi:hypothetical protein